MPRRANLRVRAKAFAEPTASSQLLCTLDPGVYDVLAFTPLTPTQDTDWARLYVPQVVSDEVWVCTRHKRTYFADVGERPPLRPEDEDELAEDPSAIDESFLLSALEDWVELTYDPDIARYPYSLRGVDVPTEPPSTTNAYTFVEGLLVRAFADAKKDFLWDARKHRQMLLTEGDDPFGPITALTAAEMAIPVPSDDALPSPWTLVQGYRHRWRGGHLFFVVAHDFKSDKVLTLEANSLYGLDGVGFRGLGTLAELSGRVPDEWWRESEVWTWARFKATYRHQKAARIKVKNPKLAKQEARVMTDELSLEDLEEDLLAEEDELQFG